MLKLMNFEVLLTHCNLAPKMAWLTRSVPQVTVANIILVVAINILSCGGLWSLWWVYWFNLNLKKVIFIKSFLQLVIIAFSLFCAYNHHRVRNGGQSRDQSRPRGQGASTYVASCSYPGPPTDGDKDQMGYCKLPKYGDQTHNERSPPPPYRLFFSFLLVEKKMSQVVQKTSTFVWGRF